MTCKHAIITGGDYVPYGMGGAYLPDYAECDNPNVPEDEMDDLSCDETCPYYEANDTDCGDYENCGVACGTVECKGQKHDCCLHDTPRTLEWCEENCPKYYSCDTAALAMDYEMEDSK